MINKPDLANYVKRVELGNWTTLGEYAPARYDSSEHASVLANIRNMETSEDKYKMLILQFDPEQQPVGGFGGKLGWYIVQELLNYATPRKCSAICHASRRHAVEDSPLVELCFNAHGDAEVFLAIPHLCRVYYSNGYFYISPESGGYNSKP